MTSQINPAFPPHGNALTADVRQNFLYAKDEIEALQDDVSALQSATTGGPFLPLDGGTIDGVLQIDSTEGLILNGPAGTRRQVQFNTADLSRWIINANAMAETGTDNSGSDLAFNRYDDSGILIDTPCFNVRSTGNFTFNRGAAFGSVAAASTTDLSRHIAIAGTNYGFNFTASRLNSTVPTGAGFAWNVGGLGQLIMTNQTAAFGSDNATTYNVTINAATATNRILRFLTAGVSRWSLFVNANAESTGNLGSNFNIQRHDDSGTLIDTPITITRSSGLITFATDVRHNAGVSFFNVAPVTTRPVVTGSRADGTALQNGLNALQSLGLITNNSTA